MARSRDRSRITSEAGSSKEPQGARQYSVNVSVLKPRQQHVQPLRDVARKGTCVAQPRRGIGGAYKVVNSGDVIDPGKAISYNGIYTKEVGIISDTMDLSVGKLHEVRNSSDVGVGDNMSGTVMVNPTSQQQQ